MAEPVQITLQFSDDPPKLREDLSAVMLIENTLWLASDETTSLERLVRNNDGSYGNHTSFSLSELLHLSSSVKNEIDIEGLDYDGHSLWLVGSHSAKRRNLKTRLEAESMSPAEAINELSRVKRKGNRFILARIPLAPDADGLLQPVGKLNSENGKTIRAAAISSTDTDSALTEAIRKAEDGQPDSLLGAFLGIPGKENGFDIEGLAVSGQRVFVGLRGPVLRGWAIVLELEVSDAGGGRLKLKNIGQKKRGYNRHLLDLQGLGIRDLCFDGDDLLVLAGPTMDHDGPVKIFRWKNAVRVDAESIVTEESVAMIFEVPHKPGADRAEGISRMPDENSVLVVYDSPGKDRRTDEGGIKVDVFSLSDF